MSMKKWSKIVRYEQFFCRKVHDMDKKESIALQASESTLRITVLYSVGIVFSRMNCNAVFELQSGGQGSDG